MLPKGSMPSLLKCPLYFFVFVLSNEKASLMPRSLSQSHPPPLTDHIMTVVTWLLKRKQLRKTVTVTPTRSMKKREQVMAKITEYQSENQW